MWKVAFAAAAVAVTTSALMAETALEKCKVYGDVAENIMKNRQAGVSLTKIMGMIEEGPGAEGYRLLMIEAYETPRWNGAATKKRSIQDFRSSVELRCLKQLSD
jgi:hypothetical protein